MKHITVKSVGAAWKKAGELFPTDYECDSYRSERAGYPVYVSTLEGCNSYICDLNARLELNLEDGETITIWIKEEPEEEKTEEAYIETALDAKTALNKIKIKAMFEDVSAKVTVAILGGIFANSEEEQKIYEALRAGVPIESDILANYADNAGIPWGTIGSMKKTFYDHRNDGKSGHYIIEGYITARIGHEFEFLAKCGQILDERGKDKA